MLEGFFSKFKVKDSFDYDDYDEEEEEFETRSQKSDFRQLNDYDDDEDAESSVSGKRKKPLRSSRTGKVVALDRRAISDKEVCLFKPHGFNEVEDISDKLLSGAAVVLNIEGLEENEAQRIIDFVFGTMHAINGRFMRVSKIVFLFAPEKYDLSGENAEAIVNAVLDVPVIK